MKPVQVIIADDHAVLRAGLRLLIDGEDDMKVVAEASDGPEAVAQARRTGADVMVLDLTMPRTDPLATIHQLATMGTRTVVLTMHDDPAYVSAALSAGAYGYIVKKAADVELLAAIRAVSRGYRFLDAGTGRERRRHRVPATGPRQLSDREAQVLNLLGRGYTNREIASRLGVSVKTAETFRARVCEKLGLRSRADLVGYALRMGLMSAEESAARDGGVAGPTGLQGPDRVEGRPPARRPPRRTGNRST